jgi:hypothetical protein
VMAWFVYNAATREQMLPRAPLPKQDSNPSTGMPATMPRPSGR